MNEEEIKLMGALKPCPFCGKVVISTDCAGFIFLHEHPTDCILENIDEMAGYASYEEAQTAWNERSEAK